MIDNFKMNSPKINHPIKISVYLPDNYDITNDYYDVLYLLDGQNAFSDKDSTTGRSLRIGQYLEKIDDEYSKKIIAVGIHSSPDGLERISEYTPFNLKDIHFPLSKSKDFYDFYINEIKPFIEKRYRCLTGPQSTIIYGAKEAAVMSLYIAFNNSEQFGNIGIFSLESTSVENELLCFLRSKFDPNIKIFIVDKAEENAAKKIEEQLRMFGTKDLKFSTNEIDLEKHILNFLKFVYSID